MIAVFQDILQLYSELKVISYLNYFEIVGVFIIIFSESQVENKLARS